jgi:hypothetical protein
MKTNLKTKINYNPQQAKKIKSDARKAEIMRLLAIQPMALAGIREAMRTFEPDVSPVVLRSTLYNMCCDGALAKQARNPKNPTYTLSKHQPGQPQLTVKLRGFPPPRRISADRAENVAIMKATPLRKLPKITPSGSSLEYF